MTEMIERVAQAILREKQNNRSAFPCNLDLARAAIEAMRVPTKAMEDVARSTADPWCESWPLMIDAALRETEE